MANSNETGKTEGAAAEAEKAKPATTLRWADPALEPTEVTHPAPAASVLRMAEPEPTK